MAEQSIAAVFAKLFDAAQGRITPDGARALLDLRFTDAQQQRIVDLAAKNSDGTLTPDERSEYEALVEAGDLLALMQAKARTMLRQTTSAA
jgi:hypothetical protein